MSTAVSLAFSPLHRLRKNEFPSGMRSMIKMIITAFNVFLYDLEFSTMTRFFPGLISAAFQNYVPKSMPKTCYWDLRMRRETTIKKIPFIYEIVIIYLNITCDNV